MNTRNKIEKALNALVWTICGALLYFICLNIVQDDNHMACPVDDCSAVATESMD